MSHFPLFLILDEILVDNEIYFRDELDPSAFLLLHVKHHAFAEIQRSAYMGLRK